MKLWYLVGAFFLSFVQANFDSPWTWECVDNKCHKKEREGKTGRGIDACKLVCNAGTLWPLPIHHNISNEIRPINADITIKTHAFPDSPELSKETKDLVMEAGERFQSKIKKMATSSEGSALIVTILLKQSNFTGFSLGQDEGYELVLNSEDGKINATIIAENFFGGRHGLETLAQLIVFDDFSLKLVVPETVQIKDHPAYTYRGILLDTARNFIPVEGLLRTLEAMADSKMNSFHWHITDGQSFPFQSKSFPKLTEYGAYSPQKVYKTEDIEKVVKYALVRGIRVIPELDAPAHVGEGWQWAPEATVCFKSEPWTSYCVEPPCGQLNPTHDQVYTILEGIYKDMEEAFKPDLFHMGGDEVNLNCWNTSSIVTEGMSKMGLGRSYNDFHELWNRFQSRALKALEKATGKKRPVILWTSTLTDKGQVEKYLDKEKYIIQIWTTGKDALIAELINKEFPVILSNYDALYFDCGFGSWVSEGNNWCSPYIPWQKVYKNNPKMIATSLGVPEDKAKKFILGSEACLWTEQADDSSLDNRLWPRAAALGENLWRGEEEKWKNAEARFLYHRERLVKDGINADTIQPDWCFQNDGYCHE